MNPQRYPATAYIITHVTVFDTCLSTGSVVGWVDPSFISIIESGVTSDHEVRYIKGGDAPGVRSINFNVTAVFGVGEFPAGIGNNDLVSTPDRLTCALCSKWPDPSHPTLRNLVYPNILGHTLLSRPMIISNLCYSLILRFDGYYSPSTLLLFSCYCQELCFITWHAVIIWARSQMKIYHREEGFSHHARFQSGSD